MKSAREKLEAIAKREARAAEQLRKVQEEKESVLRPVKARIVNTVAKAAETEIDAFFAKLCRNLEIAASFVPDRRRIQAGIRDLLERELAGGAVAKGSTANAKTASAVPAPAPTSVVAPATVPTVAAAPGPKTDIEDDPLLESQPKPERAQAKLATSGDGQSTLF